MEKLTENMIRWAESKLGSTEYAGWCLAFIEDALEISNHKLIASTFSKAELPDVFEQAAERYIIDCPRMIRYARRRNKESEISGYLKGVRDDA